eukprot:15217266-Alexandrium_andersonii.AAC.1
MSPKLQLESGGPQRTMSKAQNRFQCWQRGTNSFRAFIMLLSGFLRSLPGPKSEKCLWCKAQE